MSSSETKVLSYASIRGKEINMKASSSLILAAVALGAILFTGCSTIDSRINAQPQVFARLTPEQQALVKSGQVALGFDMDTVKLALGDPDHITIRTDAYGQTQVWHYLEYESGGVMLYTGYYHRGWGGWWGAGGWWGPAYPYYLDYPDRVVRDRFQIVFKDNKVVSIEREAP
jgi:outer membrane protein assembly factor BamE (lipoprotein component of BamABCDE complex)